MYTESKAKEIAAKRFYRAIDQYIESGENRTPVRIVVRNRSQFIGE